MEALSTINVQVAAWITLANVMENYTKVFKLAFDVEINEQTFQLKNEEQLTSFTSSDVFTSLMAGVIALTLAQVKQYMTRHANDMTFIGKVVYFLACLFNSLAIFVSQTTFFIFGLPYFQIILMGTIRYIKNSHENDAVTKPNDYMMAILNFVVVLIPLKFIPKMFDLLAERFTSKWILHKTHHVNNQNRSGYDLSGVVHSLFLPCSVNKFDHIADKESTVAPGISYFGKEHNSRHLYRLKFETHVFHKILVHTLYLTSIFVILLTFGKATRAIDLEGNPVFTAPLHSHYMRLSMILLLGVVPMLLVSFAFLYIYYNYCHPWVSEGISAGFEPMDNGLWKPFSSQGSSDGMLNMILICVNNF
jgi:hypothetical protein